MNLRKILKKTILGLVFVFVIIQFIRPAKNKGGQTSNDISNNYPMPPELQIILKTACFDCHSNTTVYPWYAEIQPAAWWLNDHITKGKKSLNFNEFLAYPLYRQYHKLEEIDELVSANEMPLPSYTWIHRDAILDNEQKEVIIHWTKVLRDSMQGRYPADSLINPRKR